MHLWKVVWMHERWGRARREEHTVPATIIAEYREARIDRWPCFTTPHELLTAFRAFSVDARESAQKKTQEKVQEKGQEKGYTLLRPIYAVHTSCLNDVLIKAKSVAVTSPKSSRSQNASGSSPRTARKTVRKSVFTRTSLRRPLVRCSMVEEYVSWCMRASLARHSGPTLATSRRNLLIGTYAGPVYSLIASTSASVSRYTSLSTLASVLRRS
jgi:hypothetical protein